MPARHLAQDAAKRALCSSRSPRVRGPPCGRAPDSCGAATASQVWLAEIRFCPALHTLEGLSEEETANFKPVRQRLVRTHPVTGRKSLYLSAHIGKIVGWETPEARIFIQDLTEDATRPEFVYSHEWKQYDFVVWDNRQVMHRVRAFDDLNERRDMRRTTVAGEEMTVEQAA